MPKGQLPKPLAAQVSVRPVNSRLHLFPLSEWSVREPPEVEKERSKQIARIFEQRYPNQRLGSPIYNSIRDQVAAMLNEFVHYLGKSNLWQFTLILLRCIDVDFGSKRNRGSYILGE